MSLISEAFLRAFRRWHWWPVYASKVSSLLSSKNWSISYSNSYTTEQIPLFVFWFDMQRMSSNNFSTSLFSSLAISFLCCLTSSSFFRAGFNIPNETFNYVLALRMPSCSRRNCHFRVQNALPRWLSCVTLHVLDCSVGGWLVCLLKQFGFRVVHRS